MLSYFYLIFFIKGTITSENNKRMITFVMSY